MSLQTTVDSPSPIASSRRYGFALDDGTAKLGTDSRVFDPSCNPLLSRPIFRTEKNVESENALALKLAHSEERAPVIENKLRNYVEGVIQTYDDVTVRCELNVEGRPVIVQLPKALFPEEIRYGLPIKLEMAEANGIRRPIVTVRPIQESDTSDIAAEFDALLGPI